MLIIFDSKTGNVRRFVNRLNLPKEQIKEVSSELSVSEPYVLITYTTGIGQIPKSTLNFLEANHNQLKAVVASGNRNWGQNFAISADKISDKYGIPILYKFEMSGMPEDIKTFKERVQELDYETYRIKQ